MQYLVLKALHVLSVVLFLGNIITGVFWKFHGDKVGTLAARAQALEGVIHSDRWFTVPGVFAIIVTGVWMAIDAHLPLLGTKWILWSLILFGISGVCFGAFVAPLQKKLLANVRAGMAGQWNEAEYGKMSRAWEIWGAVATLTPVAALFLMVTKPV
jgi:uncharacterized membrane protein